jgi:hypothetical protein
MRRTCRLLTTAVLIVALGLSASCEGDKKSNTDLKVPDVPPSGSGKGKEGPAGAPTANPK